VIVPVCGMPLVSVQPIGTACPGTSERTALRTSAIDEIATSFSEVMTSPATSPASSAARPGSICWISAPPETCSRMTPRNAVGPTWTVALDFPFSIARA
jgi:hypothetical protein